jgi:hypothetical protein
MRERPRRGGKEVADVDEQNVAEGAAGYESVASLDALAKVTEFHESGVIERLDLGKALAVATAKNNKRADAPQCRTQWIQRAAWADASR